MTAHRILMATLHARRSAQAVPLAAGNLAAEIPDKWTGECILIDLFPGPDEEQICLELLALEPDILVFPLYLWNRPTISTLAAKLKQRRPRLLLVAGGPEATPQAEMLLQSTPFDVVVRGEGEETFAAWLEAFDTPEAWPRIAGLSWRQGEEILHSPDRAPIAVLDQLPSPWLSGLLKPTPEGGVLWEVSRGCSFACDFCYDAGGRQGLRHHGQERLKAELEWFARHGATQIWILDSTFNFPPRRGKELLRLLRAHGGNIHFHLEAKADFLDGETAALIAELNCSVQVGLQSARPEVLKKVHRTFDPDRFEHALHLLDSEGVTFGLDLIYGLPGDDFAGFCHSLAFALDHAPNQLDIFPLAVLPGTPLAEQAVELGIRFLEHPPYTILATPTLSNEDLERCRTLAAGVELFYNIGRAVGFLPSLLRTLDLPAVEFFSAFASWALQEQGIYREVLLATDDWRTEEVLALQESFVQQILLRRERPDLVPAALDLIRYHFHHAETVLGPEILPRIPTGMPPGDPWNSAWLLAEGARLVPFNYEIVDLLEMEGADLEEFAALFRPLGSVALFVRHGGEVVCESLQEDFLRLLQGCDGERTPAAIFGGSIDRREAEEILEFAVSEGLLVPA